MFTKAKAAVRSVRPLDAFAAQSAGLAPRPQGIVCLLAVVLLALAIVFITAATALAAQTHVFSSSFGASGSGDGQVSLASNSAVAVNSTSHDIYVADTGNARVDQFSSAGAFIRAFGADVGGSGVNVCTTGCVAGTSGSAPGAFTTPTFIAVDNSSTSASQGDVYVGDTTNNVVTKLDATGNLISSWGTGGQLDGSTATTPIAGPFGPLAGIAVDTSGTLWVYDTNGDMFEFAQDAGFTNDFSTSLQATPAGIGVDGAGNPYIVVGFGFPILEKFDPSGNDIGTVTASPTVTGLAVDPSTNDIYVDNGGTAVDHYDPSCSPSGGAGASSCTPADSFGSGDLSGAAGLAVDYSNQNLFAADTGNARIGLFTAVIVPDLTTNPASAVGPVSATLNGHLDPAAGGNVTDCHFEYVDDATFQATGFSTAANAPCAEGNSFSSPADVHADLTGLTPESTYHVRLTAANSNGANVAGDQPFTTETAVQQVTTGAASNIADVSATLNGTVNAGATTITDCHFDYVTDAAFQSTGYTDLSSGGSAPCATTPSGSTPAPVTVDISGLSPSTAYHFRLQASNSFGTTTGQDQSFVTSGPPLITGEQVSGVGQTSATLSAQINPERSDTTYHFEYGTAGPCSANPCTSSPSPDADIGSQGTSQTISQKISGLTAGTIYFFRVVATNSIDTVAGPDQTFATFGSCPNDQLRTAYSGYLPDCRTYEQVSPLDKNGNSIIDFPNFTQAATAGNGITFFTGSGVPGGVDEGDLPTYLSSRGSGGWSTQGLLPPASYGDVPQVVGWSADLSQVFDQAFHSGQGGTLLLRNSSDGSVQTISPFTPTGTYHFDGASSDGSIVFFNEQGGELTSDAAPGADNLYAWDKLTDSIRLVGVLPDDTAPSGGSFAGPYNWIEADPSSGGATSDGGYLINEEHAISSDGSRVFFTAGGSAQLYLREQPTSSGATTVQISASQKTNGSGPGGTDPNGPGPAAFMSATPDGSHALFTSPEELTNDATTGTADQGNDLYQWHNGTLTDLTSDNTDANGAQVQGVLGQSDDGSYIYFAANGVLADGATAGDCNGSAINGITTSGTCNLYIWHNGAISFISPMAADNAEFGDSGNWRALPTTNMFYKTSRVSSDGRRLLFSSTQSLTGYDNTEAQASACGNPNNAGDACGEFYRYDAATAQLSCVSCDPTGAPPTGDARLQLTYNITSGTAHTPTVFLQRNLSADGQRVFFDSPDPLVPQDVNGVMDVYEWEADGSGSCNSTSVNDGCLYLLSTGTAPNPSYFGDASATGNDAFIFTDQPLVGQDTDQLVDIYDARVDGGLASQSPSPTTPCSGENCKPPPSGTPPDQTPGSSGTNGSGNQGKNLGGTTTAKKKHKKHKKHRKHRRANANRGGSK